MKVTIFLFIKAALLLLNGGLLAQGKDSTLLYSVYDNGFFFVGPDDILQIKGYVQADVNLFLDNQDQDNPSRFLIRRARLAATGYFQKKFRYMIYGRFDGGKAELHEAFLESRHLPYARLRIGQFKSPFSLSNLKSSAQIDFIDRAPIISNVSPEQDIGAMLFGELFQNRLDYAIGIFNGRKRNQKENNSGKDIIARVVFSPFKLMPGNILRNLYLGISWANGQRHDDLSATHFLTNAATPFFTFTDSVSHKGKLEKVGADIEWILDRASLKAEWLRASYKNVGNEMTAGNLLTQGYYITATYFLTADKKPRNEAMKPSKSFDPAKGSWGALEVMARYDQMEELSTLALADNTLAKGFSDIHSLTLGINWYPNDDVKIALNAQKVILSDPLPVNSLFVPQENVILLRFQFQF